MEVVWDAPEQGYKKINVHCVVVEHPMPNGNLNGVASIIRDSSGENLWTALGSLSDLTEEQAIVTALHAACEHAIAKGWDKTHIETVSPRVYDTISLPDHIILNDDQVEVYRNFNILYANNFKEGLTKRKVACVPRFMNQTAEFLAIYGLKNITEFGVVEQPIAGLGFHLARDMGKTLIPPYVAVSQILGDGEVVDGPPPPKKAKLFHVARPPMRAEKGKEKVYATFSFNNNGALHPTAVKLLDEGKLTRFSEEFAKQVVDLDTAVGNGIFARDVLHHAMMGTMKSIIPKIYVPKNRPVLENINGLMSVEQVLVLMGFDHDSAQATQSSSSGGIV
ncbi:hypothetical protein DCAR_0205413 [Daucus carota subsp. sativus]|uniref:Uncharacterized protein n=1 Tax=Daucus carota subsp. sativus TaxID=79200 RepID=A0A162APM5_DAUCS|nr:hypothetical protein DCAR_0205413 [Daucus carota subsp. sativus]